MWYLVNRVTQFTIIGANVNYADENGISPLLLAINKKHFRLGKSELLHCTLKINSL